MIKRPFSSARRRMRSGRRRRTAVRGLSAGDLILAIVLLALLALFVMRMDDISGQDLVGRPAISDGDSLTLLGERIRIRGIDAPELAQSCMRKDHPYACGREARDALVKLIGGAAVRCTGRKRDGYGRLLARCEVGEQDLGRAMVENGWAVSYGDYRDVEAAARKAGRGLWAGSFESPELWRRLNRGEEEVPKDWLMEILDLLWQMLAGAISSGKEG